MIYTSYFGNIRNIDTDKYKLVSIARYPIRNFDGYNILNDDNFSNLAPSHDLLNAHKNNLISDVDYAKVYINSIIDNDWDLFKKKYDGCILLCYESPDAFCHRQVLSFFLKYKKIIEIKEYNRGNL